MSSMSETAEKFFAACELGKGWEACKEYCAPDATFSAQADALADIKTLEQYTEWMKGMFVPLPDATYEVKAFSADEDRKVVTAFAVFAGTNTAAAGRSHQRARACRPTMSMRWNSMETRSGI